MMAMVQLTRRRMASETINFLNMKAVFYVKRVPEASRAPLLLQALPYN